MILSSASFNWRPLLNFRFSSKNLISVNTMKKVIFFALLLMAILAPLRPSPAQTSSGPVKLAENSSAGTDSVIKPQATAQEGAKRAQTPEGTPVKIATPAAGGVATGTEV